MIEKKAKTLGGREVIRLTPENEADLRELRRMARDGQVDDDDSLADKQTGADQDPVVGGP